MATVQSKTSIKIDDLINDTVVSGYVTPSGILILETRGGAEIVAGNVGSQQPIGERWTSALTYVPGDVVSYAGALWKADDTNLNDPPYIKSTSWTRLTGESPDVWAERDPYFNGDDLYAAWDYSIKTGSPVVSFTSVAGEFEAGTQALKISMGVSEMQQLSAFEENIVRGGDVVTVVIRAKLLSANPNAKLDAFLIQNNLLAPTPGGIGSVEAYSDIGEQSLTTDWATYTFNITCLTDNPRASVNVIATTDSSGGAVFLIDYIRTLRETTGIGPGGPDYEAEMTFASATTPWVFPHMQGTKAISVYTENSLGDQIKGDISYPDEDHVQVDFFYPQTGLMRVFT